MRARHRAFSSSLVPGLAEQRRVFSYDESRVPDVAGRGKEPYYASELIDVHVCPQCVTYFHGYIWAAAVPDYEGCKRSGVGFGFEEKCQAVFDNAEFIVLFLEAWCQKWEKSHGQSQRVIPEKGDGVKD